MDSDDPGPGPEEAPPEAPTGEALFCVVGERLAVDPRPSTVGPLGDLEEEGQHQPGANASQDRQPPK